MNQVPKTGVASTGIHNRRRIGYKAIGIFFLRTGTSALNGTDDLARGLNLSGVS